jgi:hypothetical protein
MFDWLKTLLGPLPEDPNEPKCPSCGLPPVANEYNPTNCQLEAKCPKGHRW